jgi:uncharacterized protein (TIGR03382 family)
MFDDSPTSILRREPPADAGKINLVQRREPHTRARGIVTGVAIGVGIYVGLIVLGLAWLLVRRFLL